MVGSGATPLTALGSYDYIDHQNESYNPDCKRLRFDDPADFVLAAERNQDPQNGSHKERRKEYRKDRNHLKNILRCDPHRYYREEQECEKRND